MVILRDRVHTFVSIYVRTYVKHALINTCILMQSHTCIEILYLCTCLHTYIHSYNMHNIIQIYVHIHTYVLTMCM